MIDDLSAALANEHRRHARGDSLLVEDVVGQAEASLRKIRAGSTPCIATQSVGDLLPGYWAHIGRRRECATTGFTRLDDALGGGLESQRLLVLLGAPGVGKTAFTNQVADHVANSGRPVLYVTSEDRPYDLLAKTLARIGQVKCYTAVLKGWETERTKINAALAMAAERKSSERLRYVDASSGLALSTMKALAEEHFTRYTQAGQGVLIVDYLQRLARAQRDLVGTGRDLREVVTLLTEQLRAVAVDLDCTVLALASQNRASGYNGNNSLASAKESGDIEYTSDALMALVEDTKRQPGTSFLEARLLRIDKNRQGRVTGDAPIQLDWWPDRQMFTDVAR